MIFFSTSIYALAREVGPELAIEEFHAQIRDPQPTSLPVVRTLHRLRGLEDVGLQIDGGGTVIGKVRSRHAHEFWKSKADVWISCDDDVEATSVALVTMLEAVRSSAGIVIAPCWLRAVEPRVNVCVTGSPLERNHRSGGRTLSALGGGFGLVAIAREGFEKIRRANVDLHFLDDDGEEKIGLFHDRIAPLSSQTQRWWGEDLSFFSRVPVDVRIEVLASGHTNHAGNTLDCGRVEEYPQLIGGMPK